jgi:hypothetical protein
MNTMKAIVIRAYGGPEVMKLDDVEHLRCLREETPPPGNCGLTRLAYAPEITPIERT